MILTNGWETAGAQGSQGDKKLLCLKKYFFFASSYSRLFKTLGGIFCLGLSQWHMNLFIKAEQ